MTANRFLLLLALAAAVRAGAQPPPKPPPVLSPEVLPDGRVTFRLRAPDAHQVTVNGDFWLQQNRVEPLTKGADGIWSLTTEALPPDLYSYLFTLDGVPLPDPANGFTKPGISQTQSAFFVPGPAAALLQAAAVPHGEIREVFYPSVPAGPTRRMQVYLPPGYQPGKRYPVLYLLHGGGDDDATWQAIGRVNFILDNLIAQGRATPMIVVMPALWRLDPPIPAERKAENEALFATALRNEIIPYVEAHFKVLPGPANRALGGLGDGREFLPTLVFQTLDLFGSIFSVSGGADREHFAGLQQAYPGVLDKPANIARVRFYLGGGMHDASFTSGRNLFDELKTRGYRVQWSQSDSTHGWPEFRYNFEQLAPLLFR